MSEPVSNLQAALEAGKFAVTGEIGPPKGVNIDPALHEADEYLKGRVVAVNVTDIQTAVMRFGSMATCHMLIDHGIEPVFQMVCRDRNRLALQSDLLSAYGLGIRNVLCITGDHTTMGDHPGCKPVYDLDSVGLVEAITRLESGTDMGRDMKGNPNKLDGVPKFFKGAVVTPCADEVEPQIIKLEKKVEAGAKFIQTQAVYDAGQLETFMKAAEHIDVPILAGIVMLKNAKMAEFMNANVAGVSVPDKLIEEMAAAPKGDEKKVSAQIAARLMREMKGMCKGFHLMPLGWSKPAVEALEAAGLG